MSLEPYQYNTNFSITTGFRDGTHSVVTASIDRMTDHWWVSRVLAHKPYRAQGYASDALQRAIEIAKGLGGPGVIVVAPGGYNTPREVQRRFYRRNGFEGGVMMRYHFGAALEAVSGAVARSAANP